MASEKINMLLVVIESPWGATDKAIQKRNKTYAISAMLDSLHRGEAPYASHLLFTHPGLLDDDDEDERNLGLRAGWAWGEKGDFVAVYADFGISLGMRFGIEYAVKRGQRVEYRYLYTESGSAARI